LIDITTAVRPFEKHLVRPCRSSQGVEEQIHGDLMP
jgi:hypothetical protein